MNTLKEYFQTIQQIMPEWAAVVIVLLGGWLLAIAGRLVVSKALDLLRFNHLCDRTGASDFLRKGQVAYTPAKLVGLGSYWIILFVAFVKASELLNVGAIQTFYNRITENLPNVLGAILIVIVGLVIVTFVANSIQTVARNAGLPYATLLSRITKWLGIIFIAAIAVEQVQLGKTIIGSTFQILLAAVAFGTALAFGLGCKDMAKGAMEKLIANLKESHRDGKGGDLEG